MIAVFYGKVNTKTKNPANNCGVFFSDNNQPYYTLFAVPASNNSLSNSLEYFVHNFFFVDSFIC